MRFFLVSSGLPTKFCLVLRSLRPDPGYVSRLNFGLVQINTMHLQIFEPSLKNYCVRLPAKSRICKRRQVSMLETRIWVWDSSTLWWAFGSLGV